MRCLWQVLCRPKARPTAMLRLCLVTHDPSIQEDGSLECWYSLMQQLLDQRREIPQAHLKKAV